MLYKHYYYYFFFNIITLRTTIEQIEFVKNYLNFFFQKNKIDILKLL